jgi:hypothetical protein
MKTFNKFINEVQYNEFGEFWLQLFPELNVEYTLAADLDEALIRFRNKAYPKFGNVVILAGGAGSGKGFALENLIGLEGKVFDVDALKKLAMTAPKISARVKKELGVDMSRMDLRNSDNVTKLHGIISDYLNLPDKRQNAFMMSVLSAHPDRKPNIIFDVTLKDISKLKKSAGVVTDLGYDKKNVHIVWVINEINIAKKQNKKRDRVVPEDILMMTHEGAAKTMHDIVNMGDGLKQYMDGDIWFLFNQAKVDATFVASKITSVPGQPAPEKDKDGKDKEGHYIKDANYIKIKAAGKKQMSTNDMGREIIEKIKSYVPAIDYWN